MGLHQIFTTQLVRVQIKVKTHIVIEPTEVVQFDNQNLSFLRKGFIIFRLHGSVSVLFTGPNPQSVLQMFVHWSLQKELLE